LGVGADVCFEDRLDGDVSVGEVDIDIVVEPAWLGEDGAIELLLLLDASALDP
jgi:hypothetical protein